MFDAIVEFMTSEVARYGYVAVFLLMLIQAMCVPLPSEVTLLFGGALASASFAAPGQELDLVWVGVWGTVGNVVGSWLAYWIGYAGGRPLIDRWGRYLLLTPHEITAPTPGSSATGRRRCSSPASCRSFARSSAFRPALPG